MRKVLDTREGCAIIKMFKRTTIFHERDACPPLATIITRLFLCAIRVRDEEEKGGTEGVVMVTVMRARHAWGE